MIKKISIAVTSVLLLSAHAALAQTEAQCEQVRAAVAQYGYAAAKAHADATMSADQVRAATRCLKHTATARRHVETRRRDRVHQVGR